MAEFPTIDAGFPAGASAASVEAVQCPECGDEIEFHGGDIRRLFGVRLSVYFRAECPGCKLTSTFEADKDYGYLIIQEKEARWHT